MRQEARGRKLARRLGLAVVPAAAVLMAIAPAPRPAGMAGAAAPLHPDVVEVGRTTLPGPGGHGTPGPAVVDVRLPHPTQAHDLLVAAVIDGVRTSGMVQPDWQLAGWRVGNDVIGGNTADGGTGGYATGGLQAAVFYRTDVPGGLTAFRVGSVPAGTDANVTAVVAELAGLPRSLEVVARGSSTSGPTQATDATRSTVATTAVPTALPALVLAAFTNGGTAPGGERFVHPSRWRVVGENRSVGNIDQPLLFDETVWTSSTVPRQATAYLGGSPIDNCAVMVALA